MARLIEEGDQVLLRRDDRSSVFQVKLGRELHFEKAKFTLDGLIGHPFGASFKLVGRTLERIGDPDEVLKEMMETDASGNASGKDNRDLVAGSSNQKLSQDDILQMRDEGKTGEAIIQELVSNSETFKNKTEYSQKKYLKKKMKKHVFMFTVLKPTARLIIDMIQAKAPEKICNLRIDSLSQILTYANVMSGVNVAVVDTVQGLVVGSVMERMGGEGKVVQFYPGSDANKHVLDFFDFPKHFKDNLYNFALKRLPTLTQEEQKEEDPSNMEVDGKGDNSGAKGDNSVTMETSSDAKGDNSDGKGELKGDNSELRDDTKNNTNVEDTKGDNSEKAMCTGNGNTNDGASAEVVKDNKTGEKRKSEKSEEERKKDEERKAERSKIQEYVKGLILQKDFDSLIVACRYHPTPIVLALLEYVAPSRPVVVYSAHKEALIDCYTCVKERGGVLNLKLSETWYREYQVLPGQTHPTMQMTGTGGYLLTFTTVAR